MYRSQGRSAFGIAQILLWSEAPKHNGERERGRERNFSPPEQKDHSKVDGRRRRSRLPVNITAAVSFLGAKNNKFTYRISNHAAFGSAYRVRRICWLITDLKASLGCVKISSIVSSIYNLRDY